MRKLLILLMAFGLTSLVNAALSISLNGDTGISEISIPEGEQVTVGIHSDDTFDWLAYFDVTDDPLIATRVSAGFTPNAGPDSIYSEYSYPPYWEYEVSAMDFAGGNTTPGVQFEVLLHCEGPGDVEVLLLNDFAEIIDTAVIHQPLNLKAHHPSPSNGQVGVDLDVLLSWTAGIRVSDTNCHDVYLGTDFNDVNGANTFSPEYMGNFDVNSFDPCGLDVDTWYYWRVDEINEAEPNIWKGDIWSFKTATPLIELSETQFYFTFIPGGPNPPDQTLTIRNSGIGTLNWAIDYDCNWLTVDPNSGSSTGDVNDDDDVILSIDTTGLGQDDIYTCQLTISDPNAENSPRFVNITLRAGCWQGDMGSWYGWVSVGKPECWCKSVNPRQCHGDADGLASGKKSWWASTADLNILKAAWQINNGPTTEPGICADFDHLGSGKSNWRVSTYDLNILKKHWHKNNQPNPNCEDVIGSQE